MSGLMRPRFHTVTVKEGVIHAAVSSSLISRQDLETAVQWSPIESSVTCSIPDSDAPLGLTHMLGKKTHLTIRANSQLPLLLKRSAAN